MMRKSGSQNKKNIKRILSVVLALCLVIPLLFSVPAKAQPKQNSLSETQEQSIREGQAKEEKKDKAKTASISEDGAIDEINNFEDFFIFAMASQTLDYEGRTVVLNTDLDLTKDEIKQMLEKYEIDHLTVGTKDRPFKGTFDGQNHTIKGLVYEPGIIKDPNSGLFSFTDGATIKNLMLENADLEAVYQGGIFVGHAKNTRLENLTAVNSKIKISPANNVVSLITNLGFCGGGIAGIMENSVMYNCEISGTEVVNNSTAGVTGVGGEGLYMGGLVGWAEDSTIEYSRVRSNYKDEAEGQVLKQSYVRNEYDIAVGALGGKSVYAGGIVGGVNTTDGGTTRIIDCFSTADVYFYAANYVAVGSGIAGYAGGITGALRGNSHIERCHYAGNIHSRQYNAILVIPIIQNDVNISGITNVIDDSSTVTDSYFKRSASKTKEHISAVSDWDDNIDYSAKTDTEYIYREFWESKDYDFKGIERNADAHNPVPHVNKWVMDYDLGIPVHGSHVAAAFDFPKAGSVAIESTALVNEEVSTYDAYGFAVQGIHPRGDTELTLKVIPTDSNPDDEIVEYRFDGWYKKTDVTQSYASDMAELESITHVKDAQPVSKDKTYTFEFMNNTIDKDLYVACLKARVAFYDLDGSLREDDLKYYTYREELADVKPAETPEGAVFYGWTTERNPNEKGGGYSAITSTELEKLLEKDAVYHADDPVEKTMELYPIFTSYITNVKTIFEGHDTDESALESLRENVGSTSVGSDNDGVFINVTGVEEGGAFPDGYRFLGWYQTMTDKDGQPLEVLVSKNQKYYVPDVSKDVTYTARFEYRLDYYVNTKNKEEVDGKYQYWKFYTEWVRYKTAFDGEYAKSIMPKDHDHIFHHWSTEENGVGECEDNSHEIAQGTLIQTPLPIYGHWSGTGSYKIAVISDFPNAAELTLDEKGAWASVKATVDEDKYQFIFWADESSDKEIWQETANPWEGTYLITKHYTIEAHLAAKLNFHYKTEQDTTTVLRRYRDDIFQEENVFADYRWPVSTEERITDDMARLERAASPTDDSMMIKDENGKLKYEFLGWIQGRSADSKEKGGIVKDGAEWNYIYDVENDSFCTSDATKALPYILEKDAIVTETMDLYPVYVKYDIETTTNIHQMEQTPDGIHLPNVPEYTIESTDRNGSAEVTLTAETNKTFVREGEDAKYELVGFKSISSDGTETDLWKSGELNEDNNTYTFKTTIEAGKSYTFIAIYNPSFVVYHLDGQNEETSTHLEIRNSGQALGLMPKVNYDKITETEIQNAYMIGWTETKPAESGWYHYYDSKAVYDQAKIQLVTSKTIVQRSMDLWPVFVGVSVDVNSNIDDVITNDKIDPNTVRYVENKENIFSLAAKDYPGYAFKGWYEGYQSDADKGTLKTDQKAYQLTEAELLQDNDVTYTAVYEEAFDINYYDFDGNIIYTAKTTVDEGRTFVTVEQDPDDEEGKSKEYPIDTEAFVQIEAKIKQMSEENSGKDMKFVEWRWWNPTEQKYVGWNEFKNNKITESMDLYPVAYEIAFLDTENQVYDGMIYTVSSGEDGVRELNALFTKEYAQPEITISVQEVAGVQEGTSITKGIEGIRTNVYMAGEVDEDGNPTYVNASGGSVLTNEEGLAVHELYGRLIIKKSYGEFKTNETILVNVQRIDGNGDTIDDPISVPVTVEDGVGKTELKLPLGNYRVSEDKTWTWRDRVDSVTLDDVPLESFAPNGTIDVGIDILQSKVIVYGNVRENKKWFSDFCENKNVFGNETQSGGN